MVNAVAMIYAACVGDPQFRQNSDRIGRGLIDHHPRLPVFVGPGDDATYWLQHARSRFSVFARSVPCAPLSRGSAFVAYLSRSASTETRTTMP